MWHDLVVFQRDCLVAVATLAIERDLIAKTEIDGRTNGYATTESGRWLLERRTKRRAEQVGLQTGGDRR